MEKASFDESHPQFAGMYAGVLSPKDTRRSSKARSRIDLGGISLNDETTLVYYTT